MAGGRSGRRRRISSKTYYMSLGAGASGDSDRGYTLNITKNREARKGKDSSNMRTRASRKVGGASEKTLASIEGDGREGRLGDSPCTS